MATKSAQQILVYSTVKVRFEPNRRPEIRPSLEPLRLAMQGGYDAFDKGMCR